MMLAPEEVRDRREPLSACDLDPSMVSVHSDVAWQLGQCSFSPRQQALVNTEPQGSVFQWKGSATTPLLCTAPGIPACMQVATRVSALVSS